VQKGAYLIEGKLQILNFSLYKNVVSAFSFGIIYYFADFKNLKHTEWTSWKENALYSVNCHKITETYHIVLFSKAELLNLLVRWDVW